MSSEHQHHEHHHAHHHHQHHHQHTDEEKEKKRRKQKKRMEKILGQAWALDDATKAFQDADKRSSAADRVVLSLATLGEKIDLGLYKTGRHGWEDFAADLGGVYNRHIRRNTKKAALAQEQLESVKELLGAVNESLVAVATDHVPKEPPKHGHREGSDSHHKKRKSSSASAAMIQDNDGDDADKNNSNSNKKQKVSQTRSPQRKARGKNPNTVLAAREDRALEMLSNFMKERGGDLRLIDGFSARVTRKQSNKFDTNYFNPAGRRFRSMLEVGRFFNLVAAPGAGGGAGGGNNKRVVRRRSAASTTKEVEAEKRKLRKELDRLRRAHLKASRALDDFTTPADGDNNKDGGGDDDDRVLMIEEEQEASSRSHARMSAAATRIPDVDGFPGVPDACVPDVLLGWDFLGTFGKTLALAPIALDDFAAALAYQPPPGQLGDDVAAPPVYVAEAHLALLKLLLQDGYSDDWWWSTLETDEKELGDGTAAGRNDAAAAAILDDEQHQEQPKPVIRVDVAALLAEAEDPLITASWLRALEDVGKSVVKVDDVKRAIRTAMKVASNRWVLAYLRKAMASQKTGGERFLQKAVAFLVDLVKQASPDLLDRSVKRDAAAKAKENVVEEASKQMETLTKAAPAVTGEDVVSDIEYDDDDDEDSDDSDDEDNGVNGEEKQQAASKKQKASQDAAGAGSDAAAEEAADAERPASFIPPRPPPTYVDMLLPPTKPHPNAEFINPFTWPHMVGATAYRILHRKKRLFNEVDDYMRSRNDLSPILLPERREREKLVASRLLTECAELDQDDVSPTERAIDHLCSGGNYLQLSTVERLCVLRLLIEACYDTSRVYEVVNGNIKQRTNAIKALEVEQRRAKREAKEKVGSDDSAAREELAQEAKEKFFDEKREEIRKLNEKNHEFTDEDIEALTEEDILDFDEDFKADYDGLPKPDSFNKAAVKAMVARMQEEAAFDTDALRVLTMEELVERDKRQLEEMEGQLEGFGGGDALLDASLDRETIRSIERLQRDLAKAKDLSERLPALREKALEQLRDAMADGTIKVLRATISAAKRAKLSGPDDETGGVWAVDLMRDAALELESAKQNKRVLDAQRELVNKMNRCFIRTEPMGRDRFGNRFWGFDNDEDGHVWAEAEYLPKKENEPDLKPPPGFLDLAKEASLIACGARDNEGDLMGKDEVEDEDAEAFRLFSRREYHSTGFTPTLAKNHWGCQTSEESIRATIKILDSRVAREDDLKKKLKESVEQTGGAGDDKLEGGKEETPVAAADDDEAQAENGEAADADSNHVHEDGDEEAFRAAKEEVAIVAAALPTSDDDALDAAIENCTKGIGLQVRVRQVLQEARASGSKDPPISRYETGVVTGWKNRREEVDVPDSEDDDEEMFEPKREMINVPVWRVATERGHCFWLDGRELIESAVRHRKMLNGRGYFEDDAAFFAYRNGLGRFLGRNADAPYSCSPNFFARQMIKKEVELYAKLKIRSFDNKWGGKAGERALWTNSMRDYAFDFQTAKQGLLTLEQAFFELTGEFSEYQSLGANTTAAAVPDVKALLADPEARHDVELETIEKGIPGLWNNPTSRRVFVEIVESCRTTGVLALALDLLCRNTTRYLQTHKLLNVRTAAPDADFYDDPANLVAFGATSGRRTRGMNAWQQKQQVNYEEFF